MGAKSPKPVRRLVYCFSSGISPFREDREEANAGLEEVPGLLEEARRQGIDVEEVDLSKQDEEKRRALYEQAAAAAEKSRCKIHKLFGFRRRGYGRYFGREVPALLVYRGEERIPAEVYPCRRRGRVMSIRDFLEGLLEGEGSP
jgi:Asp-tRNA(Asn)/Glu-tRNA(Gln) amidotransferase A subunit family amidase